MPHVKLFANLRKAAGIKEVSITATNVEMVVFELVKQYPALADSLLESGNIRPHVIITLNGHPTNDFDASVMEHDEVSIFPPIAGG